MDREQFNGTTPSNTTSRSHNDRDGERIAHMEDVSDPTTNKEGSLGEREASLEETAASKQIILKKLRELYKNKLLPIERKYHLHSFLLPTGGEIQDAEFDARPMVLLLGQYSTGKTTFIRHLIDNVDFPGMHIGPEPTTDKFVALVHGSALPGSSPGKNSAVTQGKILKGNSLTVTPELPFSSLSTFGSAFLNHFHASISPAELLQKVTLIDTPGVLSGEKQRLSREYDFASVAKWFADRSDLVLLLFDAHKLDISDELKDIIVKIRPHNDDKIRCVLNKADGVTREQLVKVYGSLMWSMGKIFQTPEVLRVYTGSFWQKEFVHKDFEKMFRADESLLVEELKSLPNMAAERKVNEIVKRVRLMKVHVCVLARVRTFMPMIYGRKNAQKKIVDMLPTIFDQVKKEHRLSVGDMPDVKAFQEKLSEFHDFYQLPYLDKADLDILDAVIRDDIPDLMRGLGMVSGSVGAEHSGMKRGAQSSFQEMPQKDFTNASKKQRVLNAMQHMRG